MVDRTILDHRGNPIEKNELQEPQSSRVATLHQEYANHPSRGLTPPKLATILQDAEKGNLVAQFDLFEDMEEKDGHIFAELSKRKRAILGLDWDITPPVNASREEIRATEAVKEIIQSIPDFEDLLFDLADGIGKGFSMLEHQWELLGKTWYTTPIYRPQRWFTVTQQDRNTLRLRNNSADGEPLIPFGWIQHEHKANSGYLPRSGLHRVLAWPFLFKNYSVRDLAEFLEIYGLPLRLGTYHSGATKKEKSTLLKAVMNIGHSAAGIIPEGMAIDFKESAKGQKDPFEFMISWCEKTQSKAILGGTLTSQADGKSSTNTLGNVHNEVRHDLLVSDSRQIAGTLTRDLIWPLLTLNTSGVTDPRRSPRLVFDTREEADLKALSESLPKLVDVMDIPADWAHQKTNIPLAQAGEAVLVRKTLTPKTGVPPAAARRTALKGKQEHPDLAEQLTDQLMEEDGLQVMIAPIAQLVMEAESLEEIRDGLMDLYSNMDEYELAQKMEQVLVIASLAGRYEAMEGKS